MLNPTRCVICQARGHARVLRIRLTARMHQVSPLLLPQIPMISTPRLLALVFIAGRSVTPFIVAADSTASTAGKSDEEKIIALSPFEVVSDNNGYYASNTMSGKRLNSKIEDPGASI